MRSVPSGADLRAAARPLGLREGEIARAHVGNGTLRLLDDRIDIEPTGR